MSSDYKTIVTIIKLIIHDFIPPSTNHIQYMYMYMIVQSISLIILSLSPLPLHLVLLLIGSCLYQSLSGLLSRETNNLQEQQTLFLVPFSPPALSPGRCLDLNVPLGCTCTCMYKYVHVCMYMYVCICMCVCKYVREMLCTNKTIKNKQRSKHHCV